MLHHFYHFWAQKLQFSDHPTLPEVDLLETKQKEEENKAREKPRDGNKSEDTIYEEWVTPKRKRGFTRKNSTTKED